MSKCPILLFIILAAALLATPGMAQDAADKDKRIAELEQQVATLKQQLADKDTQLAKLREQATDPETKAAQEAAHLAVRNRMQQDTRKYTRQQLSDAEQLYQVANKSWRSIEAKTCLEKMIQQFPDVNRTGCAVLYLGQMSEGAQREQYLKDAIDKYGDCFYGDGANVGSYARYILALTYQQAGQPDKAKTLFDEIRQKYPQALDHKGRLLVKQFPVEASPQ